MIPLFSLIGEYATQLLLMGWVVWFALGLALGQRLCDGHQR